MNQAETPVTVLQEQIDTVMRSLIPERARYALLDFPYHENIGDSILWLGERAALRRRQSQLIYTCTCWNFCPKQLHDMLAARDLIICQGGGNFGDLWPSFQLFRQRIISEFKQNRIVVMPQSAYYQSSESAEKFAEVARAHPDLVVLTRDEVSYAFVREKLKLESVLCPDMAFALGQLARPFPATQECVWLLRRDKESSGMHDPVRAGIDWPSESLFGYLVRGLAHQHFPILARGPAYDWLALQRILRGINILSRGKVVVSDRLHGFILALLLSIPAIALDNSYRKIKNFCQTWLPPITDGVLVESLAEAELAVTRLLREASGSEVV